MSNEEIEKVTKILSCDNCRTSYACEACDITWSDKQLIKKYISELKQENKDTYWKGYIQKQNEAGEICKMCKYRKQYFEKKVEEK